MKRLFWRILPVLLLSGCPALFADTPGNFNGREIGDIAFRRLDSAIWTPVGTITEDHDAIYVGQTDKYGVPPTEPIFHEGIEMAGVHTTRPVYTEGYGGSPGTWDLVADSVTGIGFVNMDSFERAHPVFYGFFMHPSYPSMAIRKKILDKAQQLMHQYQSIDYIVVKDDSMLRLLDHYFVYRQTAGSVLQDSDILSMRSDAFVEYCYAAAGVPIMDDNITTRAGADALISLSSKSFPPNPFWSLYPSDQKNKLVASITQNPEIKVYDNNGAAVSNMTDATDLKVELKDFQSGPGLLNVQRSQGEYLGPGNRTFSTLWLSSATLNVDGITDTYDFNFSGKDEMAPGYTYQLTAYDNAANSASFTFSIPPLDAHAVDSVGPLYSGFEGVSAVEPSTLERTHTFTFSEPTAGVSSVTIDGPQGNLVSWDFSPPVPSTAVTLGDLPAGEYQVKSWNAVGALTSTPFSVGELAVEVSTEASRQDYIYSDLLLPGTFQVTLNVLPEAPAGADKVQLVSSTGALVMEQAVSTGPADLTAFVPPVSSSGTDYSGAYAVRLFDKDGNYVDKDITLNSAGNSFSAASLYEPQGEFKTSAYDLTRDFNDAYIPGAVNLNYVPEVDSNNNPVGTVVPLNLQPGLKLVGTGACQSYPDPSSDVDLGTAQFALTTWNNADKSDAETQVVESAEFKARWTTPDNYLNIPPDEDCINTATVLPSYMICSKLSAITTAKIIPLKRYVQGVTTVNIGTMYFSGSVVDPNSVPPTCNTFVPTLDSHEYPGIYGLALRQTWLTGISAGQNVAEGSNIEIPLGRFGRISFAKVDSGGQISAKLETTRAPNGYAPSSQSLDYSIAQDGNLVFSGPAHLTLKYDPSNLSGAQESGLKFLRVVDPATGNYEELPASVDTAAKTISADVTSFSKFMVAAPEFSVPQTAQSQNSVNGAPELEFMAGSPVSLSQYDISGTVGQTMLAELKAADKLPIGNVYSISATTDTFEPSGAIKMRYSAGAPGMLGVSEDSLAIYALNENGDLSQLPYQTLDKDNKVLTARVPSPAYSLFAVLASSQQIENTPPSVYPDGIPPQTTVSFNGPALPATDGTFISSSTTIVLTAADQQVASVVTSGVSLTNYILAPDSATVEVSTYTGPFTLPEGAHPMYYMSVDNAGNYEFPQGTTVYVDATPPETQLSASLITVSTFVPNYAVISGSVSLTAADPLVNGVQSGLYGTFYLVDGNFADCPGFAQFLANPTGQQFNFSGPAGACGNPRYSGPFTLSLGTHTVQYFSVDNVANIESLRTYQLSVVSADSTPPEVVILVNNSLISAGTTVQITTQDQVVITATDPAVGGIASGVKSVYYLIDVSMNSCQSEPTFTGPSGTCDNPLYSGPFTLSAGTHTVYYSAVDNVGNMSPIASAYFTVSAAQAALPIEPSSGPIGVPFTITGSGFGSYVSGVTTVLMGGTTCPLTLWSTTSIKGTVPGTLAAGEQAVSVMNGTSTLAQVSPFTVTEPVLYGLTPSSGPIGMPFTITGVNFGNYVAGYTGVLIDGATVPLTLWSDTRIQGSIPGTLSAGDHMVVVGRSLNGGSVMTSSATFTVVTPVADDVTPSSGAIGVPFTVTGSGFGNYVSGQTGVLINGTTCPLTLWTDTKIQGTVPGSLAPGDYELMVGRMINGGQVGTQPLAFSVVSMSAYWLAPSSGPIGMPFTITGANFGNYSSAYTHVLVGDTTAPLALWTDSKIQGTVPGGLASGDYPVEVERRTADGGLERTSSMTFTVVDVDVAGITPSSGPIGMPFTITGDNFGNYVAGYTQVLMGGTTCPLTLWSDTKIQGTAPGALTPGDYQLKVVRELNGGEIESSTFPFTITQPVAYAITPTTGPIGEPFTITGESFGNYSAAYTGVLINGATVPLTLWSDTRIQGTIPGGLAPGQYPVMVGRLTSDGGMTASNALSFDVEGVSIASMTPVAGPIGMPFTIYGGNFGNYSAGNTKVLLGGTMCPLTLWSDTKIQGTVPGSLGAGDYSVSVARQLNGGEVESSTLTFSVTEPVAYSMTPSSGPIGLPFTIAGDNFGNYVANYTRVLIGGAAAPLTLWSTTTIKGSIPGSLEPGDYPVYVERALNGGVVDTSTFTYTVGVPYLAAVSPDTAAVLAPFTLTGYNFGNYSANYTTVLIGGATCPLTLWTDTKIQGKLPAVGAGTYPVQVQRALNGGLAESATAYIAVEEPAISSMTPVSGAAGTVFNLYGIGFGPYDASLAHVTIGGVGCALSLWSDTRITGTVPAELRYGTYTVVASRGQFLSNSEDYTVPGGGYGVSMVSAGRSVPSALAFQLGDVYVYPDPAKDGVEPVFHVEVGQSDSVKITVYNVAGRVVHEHTLTGAPQWVRGAYAYEYPWTGHIASGVYYYTIEAERGGSKLRASGRFAVVR